MNLSYISKENFDSLLSTELNPLQKNKIFSDLCRINILYMICSAGSGHIGSSFSSVDAMSWIMGEIKSKEENVYFFSSKGHDAPAMYCVMISLGQLDFSLLNKLRKIDGLPGHPDINTPNIFTNTGSLGMGISKAKGIIKSITSWPFSSLMPLTPWAPLPIDLTSDSEKCAAFPALETSITNFFPLVTVLPTNSSSPTKVIALFPPFL